MLKSDKIRVIISSLMVLILASACATAVKEPSPAMNPSAKAHSMKEYRIQVGDLLDIKFYYNPELNEEVTVRPDGRISLQLAHDIMATGLTPSELTKVLTKKYAVEFRDPKITVIVRTFSALKVYVGGEVDRPGIIDLVAHMTVLQAISGAGGLNRDARLNEVVVIRRKGKNNTEIIPVDLEVLLEDEDLSQDVFLQPYDIVYVPRLPITYVNQWIDQYIRRNIPIPFGVGYDLNN
jgi:protein involved in polysaccharide export with SLBB domain